MICPCVSCDTLSSNKAAIRPARLPSVAADSVSPTASICSSGRHAMERDPVSLSLDRGAEDDCHNDARVSCITSVSCLDRSLWDLPVIDPHFARRVRIRNRVKQFRIGSAHAVGPVEDVG